MTVTQIAVPDRAVEYILLQRTEYLVFDQHKRVHNFVERCPGVVYRTLVRAEAWLRKRRVKELFDQGIQSDYRGIRDLLPNRVSAVLDIGCGVGGIDVALYRHYGCDPNIEFYMLDKTHMDRRVFYGFKRAGAFYNSLKVTELMLEENGVSEYRIHTMEATPDSRIELDTEVGLVISLISWGFHYPVSTYLVPVYEAMSDGGCLIMDVRRGTEGEAQLAETFRHVQTVAETKTRQRVVVTK